MCIIAFGIITFASFGKKKNEFSSAARSLIEKNKSFGYVL